MSPSEESHSPAGTPPRPSSHKRILIAIEEEDERRTFKSPYGGSAATSPTNSSSTCTSPKRSGVKSSDFRGVSKCAKDGRWQSRIRVGKKVKYLGRFKTEIDAAKKYDEAALALHGKRSTLNFEMTEQEIEFALLHAAEKRLELGLVDSLSSSSSRMPSSRSVSPAPEEDNTADEEEEGGGELGEEPTIVLEKRLPPPQPLIVMTPLVAAALGGAPAPATTHEDQNAAVCLMWLKMSLVQGLM
ncbi:hypothetical protein BASA81_008430 [Batrachochytrium salamandrivorans]|nr:hypothetical protein BASA81_008430 [Batrachochytrium salamandrivorans]